MVPVIAAVINQKGGVGKTTTVNGLANAATVMGLSTLVVDLDPQASATRLLGVWPESRASIVDALVGGATNSSPTYTYPSPVSDGTPGSVDVLPSTPDSSEMLDYSNSVQSKDVGRLAKVLDTSGYDLVLIDCPAGLGRMAEMGLLAAKTVVAVTEAESLSVQGILATFDFAKKAEKRNDKLKFAGIVINKVPPFGRQLDASLEFLDAEAKDRYIWEPYVPKRSIVGDSVFKDRPLHKRGKQAAPVLDVYTKYLKERFKLHAVKAPRSRKAS